MMLKIFPVGMDQDITKLSNEELIKLYGLLNYENKTKNITKQVESELNKRKEEDDYLEGKVFLSSIGRPRLMQYYFYLEMFYKNGILKLDENVQKSLNLFKEEINKRNLERNKN